MQRTRQFETFEGRRKGYLAQDEATLHVLHPDDPTNILVIPHPSVAAASATFTKIAKEYFGIPRGFKLLTNVDGFTGTGDWIPKPITPEEAARLQGIARRRVSGYELAGPTLVLSLKRMRRRDDLDIVFERAGAITALHVLISEDDSDGAGRAALFERLIPVAPQLEELTLDAPYGKRTAFGQTKLGLPPALLAAMTRLERFAMRGVLSWPTTLPAPLAEVRVFDYELKSASVARLLAHPALRSLTIATSWDASLHQLFATTPLGQLAELTLEELPDVPAMIAAISAAPSRPTYVRLRGLAPSDPELVATAARDGIEVDTHESPFDETSRPAELRAMWEGLD
jgi:hypothetical protein